MITEKELIRLNELRNVISQIKSRIKDINNDYDPRLDEYIESLNKYTDVFKYECEGKNLH